MTTRTHVGEIKLRGEGLKWAKPCKRPSFIPRSRPRGAKAYGLRYERSLAKSIPGAISGQWFEYEDRYGLGWCQTDIIIQPTGMGVVFVLECKLTDVDGAWGKMNRLYIPVVGMALGLRALGIVVVRHLTRVSDVGRVCSSLDLAQTAALAGAAGRDGPTLHWLGRGRV